VVSFVASLLVIGILVLWVFQLSAAGNLNSLGHFYSTGAVFAAESGIEMALRELNASPASDFDSDGTIGSISNNGNASDDPQLATGACYVVRVSTSPPTYRAVARPVDPAQPWGSFTRTIEIQTQ
jgi:hypothetical protein